MLNLIRVYFPALKLSAVRGGISSWFHITVEKIFFVCVIYLAGSFVFLIHKSDIPIL